MMFLNILIAAIAASMFLLCVCAVVALGQLHRLVSGVNQIVDLAMQAEQRQQAIMANIRNRNYDAE